MKRRTWVLYFLLGALEATHGFSQEIKVEIAKPKFGGPGRLYHDLRISYANPLMIPESQVVLHYGYRTRDHGSVSNPVTGFSPHGGSSQWCPLLIVKDWQRKNSVVLRKNEDRYSTELTVDLGGPGTESQLAHLQFYLTLVSPEEQKIDDRPSLRGFYFVEIPWTVKVTSGPLDPPWTLLPLMAHIET